ncbi:MAG: lactoylglutathione lyase [Actinomycetota bacterium]|nr:lactoylglutathione lyase [Actinomycetota bacterium]
MAVAFNHVGQCVTDLDRSRRFYVELFEFEVLRELHPPDDPSAKLLRLDPPLGMTALYLQRDGFVLELLHFSGPPARPYQPRVMNDPGLTHLSLSCDLERVVPLVAELGGEVLADTDIGGGLFVRDPDGQLVELLPLSYAERVARGK